jgi:hypothetical protein
VTGTVPYYTLLCLITYIYILFVITPLITYLLQNGVCYIVLIGMQMSAPDKWEKS